MRIIATLLWAALPGLCSAEVVLRFYEGAPTDAFEIRASEDGCLAGPATLAIDLGGSAGGLILDVTGQGAGVEVFQPLVVTSGADFLADLPVVADGDTVLTLELAALPVGAPLRFTLDLDDTLGPRGITVAGSELTGALARLSTPGGVISAPFGADNTATLKGFGCHS